MNGIDDRQRSGRPAGFRRADRRAPSTQGFAALHDHARLPGRFFGRLTAAIVAGLRG